MAAARAPRRRAAPLFALLLLLALLSSRAQAQADAASQAAALRQIGDALGATRGGFTQDPAASDPCDPAAYPGVSCDANGQVTSITLSGQPLSGASLPDNPATWAALPGLRTLDAANAGLTGALPAAGLAAAPALATVNLSGNDLSGSLAGLSAARSLESANLSGNAKLCGDVPEGLSGKADVAATGAGSPCGGETEAAAAPSPAPEDAAAAAEPAAPDAAAPAPSASSTPPVYCVCGTDGLDSQRCKDEVYNSCNAEKTATPAASCGDLTSGDAARVQAAVDKDCGGGSVATAPSPSPSPTTKPKPPPAGDVAEVAAPPASPAPPPVQVNSALPVCACALQGFASAQCGSALQSACAAGGSNPPPEQACSLATGASSSPKDAQQAQDASRALASYLQGECFPGSDPTAQASPCACFSSGVGSNDCARARVQACARGEGMCVPLQALSAPAGSPWLALAPNAQADAASYARDNCPVAPPTQTGVQAALTFQGVSVPEYQQGYAQGVANALAQVGGVPNSDVQAVDLRPAQSSSSGRRRLQRAVARRFLLQSSSSGAVQSTYFLRSSDPEALAQRLQTSAQDGSLERALGNNGVQAAPSLSLKSYLPAGSLGGEGGADGASGGSNGGFPLWALAPIIIGSLLLLGLLIGGCLLCRRRRARARASAVPAGKLVVGGGAAAAAGVGAAGVGMAAAYNGKVPPAVAAAPAAAAPTAYSADPYADPYAPVDTTTTAAKRTGSESLNAALGGARPAAAAVGVGAVGGAAAVAAATRGGKDIQSVPIEPSPPRPTTGSASAAAPSAAEWRSTSSASQQQRAGSSGGVGAGTAAAAAGAAGVAGGAAAAGAGAGKTSAQQAERAKFWAQFQESWQQVRQNKPSGGAAGGPGGKPGDDEPGTPSSGTQWTDQ
jgi:hypothetical protein